MTQEWDVVIIGGGLAGYVAANYLMSTDLSVLIIEKGKHVGGRAQTNIINQQYLNIGPHALYKKGKAVPILEELGIDLSGSSPQLGGVLIEDNMEYVAPLTISGLFKTNFLNGKERLEWMKVLLKLMNTNPEKLVDQTFRQWVEQVTHSNKVATLLYLLGRLATYCHAPELISAKVMVANIKNAMGGVLYLDGGWQTIIDQLHNKAIIQGVQVHTQTLIKQIVREHQNQFKLILANKEEIFAKYVICTTGPHELQEMLKDRVNNQNTFLKDTTAIKGATLDLALSQLPNPELLFAMDIRDPLYYSVHSNYAKLSDNPKSIVLHVFKYHHPNEQIDGIKTRQVLESYLDKLQPGWQAYVIAKRFIPNITVNNRLPRIGDEQKLLRSKTDIPGLYIAGDWASPGSILADAAVSSGKRAAEEIILIEKRKNSANDERGLSAI